MVKYSVKFWPTLPSAKYQVVLTGPGVAFGVGVPVVVGVGVLVGVLVAVTVEVLVGVASGITAPIARAPLPGSRSVHANTRLPTIAASASPKRAIIHIFLRDDRDIPLKLFAFIKILSTPLY